MKLPDFEAWAIFARVAEHGSFSQAARELHLSPPTVSKAISRLEQSLGVALFSRNSRHMSLTQTGQLALERANRMFMEAEAAENEVRGGRIRPSGLIRMTAPTTFGLRYVSAALPSFLRAYPEIDIAITFTDSFVDLVSEGYDVAIRIAALEDSALRARRVCTVRRLLVASPDYLAQQGEPTHPRELEGRKSFVYVNGSSCGAIRLMEKATGAVHTLSQTARLQSDNAEGFLPALEAGLGFGLMPDFMVSEAMQEGRLQEMMPGWKADDIALYLVTSATKLRPQRVSLLMEHLIRQFSTPPWRLSD
ncbi:LysR family transcriptional regulator [Bombella apis]|uniref:LysR family transcriptional regulator n=1 Tax=Bombella apis TaxID=1785988 RepID=A0ABR9MR12_9PROT|nr:LysR family transcriptional regulator [Bombella apis]MBE1724318.1 LysR family transcriptional regulator [Bombella apis]MBR9729890.1 LysR family transcriptional regulator [Bombella apis]